MQENIGIHTLIRPWIIHRFVTCNIPSTFYSLNIYLTGRIRQPSKYSFKMHDKLFAPQYQNITIK